MNFKKNAGITLVALSVIIIVLIILASISIATLSNEDGNYSKTMNAKENYNISQYDDAIELAKVEVHYDRKIIKKGTLAILGAIQKILEEDDFFQGATYKIQKYEHKDSLIITTSEGYVFIVGDEEHKYIGKINEINIDEESPQIELTASETDWTNQDVTLTAKVQDTGSGIIEYAWTNDEIEPNDWEKVSQITSQITQTNTVSENVTIYFWAKDGMGNVNVASITIDKIDKIEPSTPVIHILDISIRATGWQYKISVSNTSDADSKIKNYEYMLGSSSSTLTESTKLVTGTSNPNYTIKVRAIDNAGNYSSYSNEMVLNIERLYIRQLYQALRINGGGSEDEIDSWESQTANKPIAQIAYEVFHSEESKTLYSNVNKEEMVEKLYNGILGRSVDSSGLNTYTNMMTSDNWSDINSDILKSLVNSPEAQNLYSAIGLGAGTV